MRQALVIAVSMVMGTSAAASAESFGGWSFKAPKGYTSTIDGEHITFTKMAASSFCSIALFKARLANEAMPKEQALEWQTVIENNFTVTDVRRAGATKTKRALPVQPTVASIKDTAGNEFAATHYAVMPPGMIASVLLTSSTAASLKKCAPVAKAFLDSLAVDESNAGASDDPEARVQTPIGRWGASATDSAVDAKTPAVSNLREYTFAADGTYKFRSEAVGGKLKEGEWRVVEETGTFKVSRNLLTLVPQKVTATIHDDAGARPGPKVALEKVTYTWQKQYVEATNDWRLVMTPPKKTARDGELSTDAKLSYVYSETFKPEWKQAAPKPIDDQASL